MQDRDHPTASSKFAWLTTPGRYTRPAHDIVVASNDHFVAMPSLGSLVHGWTLIVPRRAMPTLSLMDAAERKSFSAIKDDLMSRLEVYGMPVYSFEHGGTAGSLVSCGVDQAHLHLVPLPFDLIGTACKHDLGWLPTVASSDLSEVETHGREYLFVEAQGVSKIGFPEVPISQWFRQLIAFECGVEEWDYKANPNFNQLKATAAKLRAQG